MRSRAPAVTAALAGVLIGAVLTLAVQSSGQSSGLPAGDRVLPADRAPTTRATPTTFLAWVPRGLPSGFGNAVAALPEVGASTVVAEDIVWLEGSWSAAGEKVDDPTAGFRIPLDAAAVDPVAFAAFVPEPDRPAIAAVAGGQAVLSTTGASLRGLGPGATLGFDGDERIRVAAVLPDELLGAAEVLVSRVVGRRLGVEHERYLLVRPVEAGVTTATVKQLLRPLLPASLGINRKVQVRAPGDTPYFRAGDAVLPLAAVKTMFGEFSAMPKPNGYLVVDPEWLHANIERARLPAIGLVTCHRAILPQLEAAMRELVHRDLGDLVESYHGCFVPRYIGRDPANLLSYHSWGVAFDINLVGNYRGEAPAQPPALVDVLERWGFTWGGRWIVPDASHFEFHRMP